jgi:hypothetical protein
MNAKEVFARYSEALDRGDLATMTALVADDFKLDGAGLDGRRPRPSRSS